jgi:hypothetical protein
MKRKDFYAEYYTVTNRIFADKTIWGTSEREQANRKGQIYISKLSRKVHIVIQYLLLLLNLIPIFDNSAWVIIPVTFFLIILCSFVTDFSIIKIELLYSIYRKDNVYASILYDIFRGDFDGFLDDLKRETKKSVIGYVHKSGKKFCGKYFAVCRNKENEIFLTFKKDRVIIKINNKLTVINKEFADKSQLLSEIAAVINETC